MEFIYETIKFNKSLPIKIFVHSVNYVQNHWHNSIELLFILSGSVNIVINAISYELKEEDIILINSNEIHSISSKESNTILALQIPIEYIKANYDSSEEIMFNCKSFNKTNEEQYYYDSIRNILAKMMWFYSKNELGFELKIQSLLFDMIYILFRNFKDINHGKKNEKNTEKYLERLSRIIKHIDENYNKEISLNSVAKSEFLSVAYLSKFFSRYMGMTFSSYLNNVRFQNAVKNLIYTDLSITEISINNGFFNEKTFFNLFKEFYDDTPNQYRKKIKNNLNISSKEKRNSVNYFEVDSKKAYTALFKYLKIVDKEIKEKELPYSKFIEEIDITKENKEIYHNWKCLTTIGKAKDGLFYEVQKQLTQVQKEIGFKYIRFHGIFDDEMMVYDEDKVGNPIYNFTYIDRLFEFFYSIGLKPFVELGFMPEKLAKNIKTIMYRKSIISMPKDIEKWKGLLKAFIEHCINHFGKTEVESWYFEVWNEPNMKGMFWFDTEEDYYKLYESSFKAIKEVSKNIKVGGPALTFFENDDLQWLRKYIEFCSRGKCEPDFISAHFYPHKAFMKKEDNFFKREFQDFRLIENEDSLKECINKFKNLLKEYKFEDIETHMTEWNSNASHRDLCNDTCYKAAYITKNVLENMDKLDSMAYWSITDLIEEFQASSNTFHGGLGVITNNGIKKAGYYAFWLLNKLGNINIASGEGYYITSSKKGYEMILYNYCHFDKLYCQGDTSKITIEDRYDVFTNNYNKEVKLLLKGFKEGLYEIKEYSVNRRNGSPYDTWLAMVGDGDLNLEEIDYLNNKSIPSYSKTQENINSEYLINRELTPHEIRLIEINIKY